MSASSRFNRAVSTTVLPEPFHIAGDRVLLNLAKQLRDFRRITRLTRIGVRNHRVNLNDDHKLLGPHQAVAPYLFTGNIRTSFDKDVYQLRLDAFGWHVSNRRPIILASRIASSRKLNATHWI